MYNLTYGDLDDALLALGFTASTGVSEYGAPYKAYDNPEHDAWISVPNVPRKRRLHTIHLMSAEHTVVWKGVADSETFHKLLEKHEADAPALAS